MKKNKLWACITGLFLALTSSSVAAGECGYEKCWGAVAFGPSDKISYTYGKWSKRAAFRAAYKGCLGKCTEVRTFYNTCASVARASDRSWVLAHGKSSDEAQNNATDACSTSASGCRVIVWACSR